MQKIHKFLYLSRKDFVGKLKIWGELQRLDRNLASRATAKGHIHRIGPSAKPSKGLSTKAQARKAARYA